eukprot:CAMPEP_0174859026 /NCGR_PEP_ID=MMETSP1114-20130205/44973_1 /TAXON_ID=312471 /ORGANISM="Neobodo designis, Strain CCAP 1951/1" /LENGTH=339 /DNA_ID=CAMNT_0016093959 /DNA_START=43 /DNA_END=1059 /DNA_ORIENTATION=+
MQSRRCAHDLVDDLLRFDEVLQSRVETLVSLVAREAALRENAEFYKHRSAHQQGSRGRPVDAHPSGHSVATARGAFDGARSEVTMLFRKLHRKLAASTIGDLPGESQSASDEVDSTRLPFAISNLSSLLRSGSVVSSSATRANLREMLRNPVAGDNDREDAACTRKKCLHARQCVQQRRQELLSIVAGECERHGEGARRFRETCSTRECSFGVCGCDSCMESWGTTLQSLVPTTTASVPTSDASICDGIRKTLAIQLSSAKRSVVESRAIVKDLRMRREALTVALSRQRAVNSTRRAAHVACAGARQPGPAGSLLWLRDAAVSQSELQAVCDAISEGSH